MIACSHSGLPPRRRCCSVICTWVGSLRLATWRLGSIWFGALSKPCGNKGVYLWKRKTYHWTKEAGTLNLSHPGQKHGEKNPCTIIWNFGDLCGIQTISKLYVLTYSWVSDLKKSRGNTFLQGCEQAHLFSVLSKPHPAPHSKRSCNSKMGFLREAEGDGHFNKDPTDWTWLLLDWYFPLIKFVQPCCVFSFLPYLAVKLRHQGMIQLANLQHQRLDVNAACLKATPVEDEGWEFVELN